MSLRSVRYAFAIVLVAGLLACQKKDTAATAVAATNSPAGTVSAMIESLKSSDLKALLNSQLPPAEVEKLRQEWATKKVEPIKPKEAADFAENMAKLTAPNAEQQMFSELAPKLAEFDKQMGTQMPMWVGMGQSFVNESIKKNQNFTDAQKDQATQTVNGLAKWAMETKFTDPDKAKQAIGVICAAAREIDLKSLDQARALDFDQLLAKGSVAIKGTKKLFDTYGLSLDKVLDSAKVEVLSEQGDSAKLKVSYTLFGLPISGETEMVRENGRWYGKQLLADLRKPHVAETAPADDEGEGEADGGDGSDMPAEPVPPASSGSKD